jgi:hypothetical protein
MRSGYALFRPGNPVPFFEQNVRKKRLKTVDFLRKSSQKMVDTPEAL